MNTTIRLFTLLLIFSSSVTLAQPKPVIQPFLSGFDKPIKITHANDNRLFVAEMSGKIKVVKNGIPIHSPAFLDIRSKLSFPDWAGIFSIAFHPNYQTNGYFYVLYNLKDSYDMRVSRFQREGNADSDIANATETPILTIPYTNIPSGHRGGDMAFGKDNFLYVSTGDNGPGGRGDRGDPLGNAQNPNLIFGKILRIDVDSPTPSENILEKVWAKGLRNPWRFSFDRLSGDFWFGDNGQDDWEEINLLKATDITSLKNFGWNYMEGNAIYENCNCTIATSFIAPKLVYPGYNNNGNKSASAIGGYVYRGTQYPQLQGCYFFGDYSSNRIGIITPDDYVYGAKSGLFDDVSYNSIISFGEGYDGELYTLSYTAGTIGKITLPADPLPVKLKALSASNHACTITIDWESSEEDRFSHFEVQRSRTAKTFETIKIIPAAGADNSYHFNDKNPIAKNSFYRLKMVDKDQTFEYSRIVAVVIPCEVPLLTISPNPTADQFKIAGVKSGDVVHVYNSTGIAIITKQVQRDADIELSLKSHPKGIYTVSIQDSDSGVKRTFKLAKL